MEVPSQSAASCEHTRGHITDSRFYGNRYATDASRQIFCDICRMQRWLDVESTLAKCQAELGMIPMDAAREIARTAKVEHLDLEGLPEAIVRRQHSLVPLLEELEEACRDDAGQWVHFGATTQDIQDTAQGLEMRQVLDAVDTQLNQLLARLARLAKAHRDTLMVGRTHGRAALPTTFGLKVAGWRDELCRHQARLDEMRPRVLVAQLFGGVGTMAGFAEHGPALLGRFAAALGLEAPELAWHNARDRIAEYVSKLAMLTATLARIADEVRTLSGEGLEEIELGWKHGAINSSTMPHKRNPESCEQVVVLARLARAQVDLSLDAMMAQEHERDSRGLRLEWACIADVSHYAMAALEMSQSIITGLKVDVDQMSRRAHELSDRICSEALMLALAPEIGKQRAHRLVYELSQQARDQQESLRALAAVHPAVSQHLSNKELAKLFDPSSHLGQAAELVDAALDGAAHAQENDE